MLTHFTRAAVVMAACLLASSLTAEDTADDFAPYRVVANEVVANDAAALKNLVSRCVLIAHCRAENVEGHLLYKVIDVWMGEYDPNAFASKPRNGFINTMPVLGIDQRSERDEVILFIPRRNQPKEGIARHELALPVRDNKVEYAIVYPDYDGLTPTHHSLADFKRHVKSFIEDKGAEPVPPERAKRAPPQRDFSGSWRVFLPAGFEWAVTMKPLDENRYRLEPGDLTFSGVYEAQGDRLVLVEPTDPNCKGFEWTIRSQYFLTMSKQATSPGADYMGATLFRGQAEARAGKQ